MTVYLVTAKGTLHAAVRDGQRTLTDERDNLDDAKVVEYEDYTIAQRAARRKCRRCFGGQS